jgi:hypothetical protein
MKPGQRGKHGYTNIGCHDGRHPALWHRRTSATPHGLPGFDAAHANQRDALQYYHEKRGMELRDGLWMDLLRSATMKGLFDMRLYVQNEISFGDALSEFAELIILREWNQRNEFAGHADCAVERCTT